MISKNDFKTHELRMVELTSKLNTQYEGDQYEIQFEIRNEMQQQAEADGKSRLGSIRCNFRLTARTPDRQNIYAMIQGVAIGLFSVSADTTCDEFENMLRLNGMVTILPMMRSCVYNIANTLTIRAPMIIPNIDVTTLVWNDSESAEPSSI